MLIESDFLLRIVEFLHSCKWMFNFLNTEYVKGEVLLKNYDFLTMLDGESVDLNSFISLKCPDESHPRELQQLVRKINEFTLAFELIDYGDIKPVKRISVKKQYEIENVAQWIQEVCKDQNMNLVDFGSGLGYLSSFLCNKFGFRVLGLESCQDRVEKAIERQKKDFPDTIGKLKYRQHFVTLDSPSFILEQLPADSSPVTIIGLHGCGDLTITAMNLFLNMERVRNLVFLPCCYHKMSTKDVDRCEFNFFPTSNELSSVLENYKEKFLGRPFLRLAGQQSPKKWKEMTEADHWVHGKNMFERAMVDALLDGDIEDVKRFDNKVFPDGRVSMNEILKKYKIVEKSSGKTKDWKDSHHQKFEELRQKYPRGEELSENLFCLQTAIQNCCENLVLVDRIRFIEEQAEQKNLKLDISIKKLKNDKLSPRCLIFTVKKMSQS